MRETASVYKAELHWLTIVEDIDSEYEEQAEEIRRQIVDLRRDMEPDRFFGDKQ